MNVLSGGTNKPNRLDLNDYGGSKNEKYHLDYAKHNVNASQTTSYAAWLKRLKVNKQFYANKQWEHPEDKKTFLMDESGNARNRMRVVFNKILPIVEQFRGNASILKINASAKTTSKESITRREKFLATKITKTRIANEFPHLGKLIRERDESIGETEKETSESFENLYRDAMVEEINDLIKYVAANNEYPQMQMPMALSFALSGLIVTENYEHAGHLRTRLIQPEEFFFDQDARKNDLTDAAFMGYWNPMDVSLILEKYQPGILDAKILENFVSAQGSIDTYTTDSNTRGFKTTRIPVYKCFWKDSDRQTWGYIDDGFGPELVRINYTKEGEDAPQYTDKDLIDPPESSKNKKRFKGKKKTQLFYDCIRYCTFIPGEYVSKGNEGKHEDRKNFDIVLDYGLDEYQEVQYQDLSNVKFPIKCETWGYIDGEIFSPVDAAIDPQRLTNRLISVAEQQINNSGGKGMVFDTDAVDPDEKDDILSDAKEGKPIGLRSRGKGIPNTISNYDHTPGQGTYNLFGMIPMIDNMTQGVTGVNDALKGESTGPDQLVGVTELLIQRGSLQQEPFYAGITSVILQNYQYAATCGKRLYIENERELEIAVGEDGAKILKLSKDIKNEDFSIFVTRENDNDMLKSQANNMLGMFKEFGLISDDAYVELFDRSTPDDVTRKMRSEAGLKRELAKKQAKELEAAENQAVAEAEFLQERDRSDKLHMSAQPERITDKQIQGKMDEKLMDEAFSNGESI